MQHNKQRCKMLQWYLDHTVQLQKGVENRVFTSQEALDKIYAIKVHTHCRAYQDYQDQAKANYVNAMLQPRKVTHRSEEVVDDHEPSEASMPLYHVHTLVYASSPGTKTESYDLLNITHSPVSECDMLSSDSSSAVTSPEQQSTNDGRPLNHDCTW